MPRRPHGRASPGCSRWLFQDGTVAVNPVRDATAKNGYRQAGAAPTHCGKTGRLIELFRTSERAAELDLPDLVDWMLATGCRIGEALALRYGTNGDGKPILDLEAGTWEANATVVRVPGAGLKVTDINQFIDRTSGGAVARVSTEEVRRVP